MPSVENVWINGENIIGKAGKSFAPTCAKTIVSTRLCKTTHVLAHTIHIESHTISTATNSLLTVVTPKLSTLSTALIIMIMNLFNKRRIIK